MTPALAALAALLALVAPVPVAAPPRGASAGVAAPAEVPGSAAETILHVLDYVSVDYPEAVKDGAIADQGEYDEQLEFVARARALVDRLPERAERAGLAAQADALLALVRGRAPGPDVAGRAQRLRRAVIAVYDVPVAPRRAPDLAAAATLYAAQCASCHGATGRGDGPAAKALTPPPANFHDRGRMAQRSVFGLYTTISLGVPGTGMVGFAALSDEQRWGLAFHVSALGTPGAELASGADRWRAGEGKELFGDLRAVATLTEREVRERAGADAAVLAFLRSRPDAVGEDPLARGARLLRESAAAYRAGDARAAQDLAMAAYLDGFELVEPVLDAVDRPMRAAVEAQMLRHRALLRDGAPVEAVEAHGRAIADLLDQVRGRLGGGALAPMTAFAGALVILLREGLEAIVVVAAIAALLVKAGRRDALSYVHAGWAAALALGAVTWVLASRAVTFSGASRETTEGATALIAAGMLLSVGFWMHSKAYSARWQAFIGERLGAAVSHRATWALALLSFLAVYREAFETVLFAQALWQQAGPDGRHAALGGFASALVALAALGWVIVRGSARLPVGVFFGATSALLALLAVVFAGKGVAALQEAGVVPVSPVHGPALPVLGLYPSAQGLVLQAALMVTIAAGFALTHRAARRAA